MRRDKGTLTIFVVAVLIASASFVWWRSKSEGGSGAFHASFSAPKAAASRPSGGDQRPGGKWEPSDPRWEEWRQRKIRDPSFQWKMPIEFYGKVVDQDGRAVVGAKLDIIGTDASPTGNFKRTLVSNDDGNVSLSGVSGKGFDVLLSKEGYDEYRGNRKTFEYAAFWDPFFYQPDPAHPVVLRLRKRSIAEPIAYKQTELHFGNGTVGESNLYKDTGLRVVLLDNRSPREHKWSARIEILNGAIRPTIDEFPVEAPTDGYQSTVVIDTTSPKPPYWQSLYEGASFYLKTSSNYGRLNVKMIPGKQWLRIESWINPRDGSRNLEYDPSQTVLSANP